MTRTATRSGKNQILEDCLFTLPGILTWEQSAVYADTPVVIGVLANDSDPFTIVLVGNAAHGSTTHTTDTVTYTPAASYSGVDSFVYTIEDSGGKQDTATVLVNVAAVSTVVLPNQTTTATYTSTTGLETDIQIPAGAVTESVTLLYTEVDTPGAPPANFQFAGRAFNLGAYEDGLEKAIRR